MPFLSRSIHTPSVTFATTCWQRDWQMILEEKDYLKRYMIDNHCFDFQEKILIINNVEEITPVVQSVQKKIKEKILTNYFLVKDLEEKILTFFQLEKKNFITSADAAFYENVDNDWIYYNALGPLCAIYTCRTKYLLYMTGDVILPKAVSWIEKAIKKLEKNAQYTVANLVWNKNYQQVKEEAVGSDGPFYVADKGFSDQMFLVKIADFRRPIYGEIHPQSTHFPRGYVWERRVFSHMLYNKLQRITYKGGFYIHDDTPCSHTLKKV